MKREKVRQVLPVFGKENETMRKPVLLAIMLLMLATTVGPALAQGESVVASGMIEKPEVTAYQYGTHAITDETSGAHYALGSEQEGLLDGYVGQRVVVYGTVVPDYENGQVEGGPALLDVTRVEPVDHTVDCAKEDPETRRGARVPTSVTASSVPACATRYRPGTGTTSWTRRAAATRCAAVAATTR